MLCVKFDTRTHRGAQELDVYLSRKHDGILAKNLQPNSYNKTLSLVIVDGFAVELTDHQVHYKCIYTYTQFIWGLHTFDGKFGGFTICRQMCLDLWKKWGLWRRIKNLLDDDWWWLMKMEFGVHFKKIEKVVYS